MMSYLGKSTLFLAFLLLASLVSTAAPVDLEPRLESYGRNDTARGHSGDLSIRLSDTGDSMTQRITIEVPPSYPLGELVLDIDPGSGLRALPGRGARFRSIDDAGARVEADGLAVHDSAGTRLPAWVQALGGGARVAVNDTAAVYPVTVELTWDSGSVAPPASPAEAAGTTGSTLVVTVGNNLVFQEGNCSLPEAITNANDNAQTYSDCPAGSGDDTIVIATDIDLTTDWGDETGTPKITDNLTIEGGGHTLTVDPLVAVIRHFEIAVGGLTVTIEDLTLTGGNVSGTGGSVLARSGTNLTMRNCALVNNSASGNGGGGIWQRDGDLTILDCCFSSNAGGIRGGGLYVDAAIVTIARSSFVDNVAEEGGALAFEPGPPFAIDSSLIQGNTATNLGGGIVCFSVSGELTNTILTGNYADGAGGGVYSQSRSGSVDTVSFVHVTVAGNYSGAGGGGFHSAASGSGAEQTLIIENSIVWGNDDDNGYPQIRAWDASGGDQTLTVEYSLVESVSPWPGTGNVVISTSIDPFVLSHPASSAPTSSGNYHLDYPDGIAVSGRASDALTDAAGLVSDFEGDVRFRGPSIVGLADLGADELGIVCTMPATVDSSKALRRAVDCLNLTGGGTIVMDGPVTLTEPLWLDNGLPPVSETTTLVGNSHTVERAAGADSFRLFEVLSDGHLTLNNMSLSGGDVEGDGGGIYNQGDLVLTDVVLDGHHADGRGGAVYVSSTEATLDASDTTFSGSSTDTNGGGLYLRGTTTFDGVDVIDNTTAGGGGGLLQTGDSSSLTITDSTLRGNDSGGVGGGCYLHGGTGEWTNVLLSGNRAGGNGGAVNAQTDQWLSFLHTTFAGNSANSGGALAGPAVMQLASSLVSGNSTPELAAGATGTTLDHSGIEGGFAGTGNVDLISGDALFLDPLDQTNAPTSGGNYHLDPDLGNPAVNAGLWVLSGHATPSTDIDGDSRSQGNNPDLGFDEIDPCSGTSFPATLRTDTSLIRAIDCANANGTADTIHLDGSVTLDAPDNTADGDNGTPSITTTVTIDGAGATLSRDAASSDFRLFHVASGGSLTLSDMVVSGGVAAGDGGGILTDGTLVLSGVTVEGNTAGVDGGGVELSGSDASLLADRSIFRGNAAGNRAGAIGVGLNALVTLEDCMVTGNSAVGNGGAIRVGASGELIGTHVTFAGNASGGAGGALTGAGQKTIVNSLFWGNSEPQISTTTGTFTYSGVEGGRSGTGNVELFASDPLFDGALTYTSAPTTAGDFHLQSTIANPVFNMADSGSTTAIDIDGQSRPMDSFPDMGADEVSVCGSTVLLAMSIDSVGKDAADHPLFEATDSNGAGISGYNVYRTTDASTAVGSWSQILSDAPDDDLGTAGVQLTDDESSLPSGGIYYYEITPNVATCAIEGPR